MAYNYVVTNQKPTTVTHALTSSFTSPDALNLLLIRNTRLEVHEMGPEGLVPVGGRFEGGKGVDRMERKGEACKVGIRYGLMHRNNVCFSPDIGFGFCV